METKVKFNTAQEVPASELNALQDAAQAAMDHIVKVLLFDEGRFSGLMVSKNSALEIAIGKGYFINNGAIYPKTEDTAANLQSFLPSTGLRKVLVLVSGETANGATESRRFLIDAATRATQPRQVSTRTIRQASIDIVAGVASNSPSRPAVGAGWKVVAELTIGPSGITVDPVMEEANRALTLESAIAAIALLQAQDRKFSSMMDTIRSEITGLAQELRTKANDARVTYVVKDVLNLREKLDIADANSHFGFDNFVTDSESDEAFSGYTARVEGGTLQMGMATNATKLIALTNPNDAKLDISESGLILPASTSELRLECNDYDTGVSIASYGVSTIVGKKLNLSRTYIFYATKAGRSFAEAYLSKNKNVRVRNPADNAWQTISLDGKTWKIEQIGGNLKAWKLMVSEAYWDFDAVDLSTSGSRIAQTMLNSQGGWYKRVDFYLVDKGSSGNVTVTVCELTEAGTPNLGRILSVATVAYSSLNKGWNNVALFDPFYLVRGRRYGIVLTTPGAHVVGASLSNGITHGTLLASGDGTSWQVDLAKDLMFRLYACKFNSTKVVIDIEDVDLAGGIREVQAMLTGYQPSGTDLVLEGRIAGAWRSLTQEDETVLNSAPSVLPLRLVFIGTKDLMPAIDLSKSRVIASRPLLTSTHISTIRSLGAGTTSSIKVIEVSDDFDEAAHDWVVTILSGAGYATVTTAASVTTKKSVDGRTQRTWIFSPSAIGAYRVKTVLTASSIDNLFSVFGRQDEAS